MGRGSTAGGIPVNDLMEALRSLGANPTALAARVGLSVGRDMDRATRVPSVPLLAMLDAAARELRDPLVGLHAGARVETRGPLFYLLLSSPRLSEGLRLFAQFARVPLDTQTMQVAVHGGIVTLAIDTGDADIERSHHAVDYIVGANLSSLRRAVPGFRLLEVELTHAEVGDPGETARVFGCPVRFGRRRNALRFPDSTLDHIPTGANPVIAEQIRKYTEAVFAQIDSDRVIDRAADAVRALLAAGLPADRTAVARRLHVSERTLQRQLEQEAMTFKALRDGIRAELSRALLGNRALKVEVIAQSVGFAEAASFSKAFTRWSGCSPSRYREQLGDARAGS